jgi:N6-L-threonylcarbamoyladenine synthase
MKILGIETSCDETAASLLQVPRYNQQDTNKSQISKLKHQILSNVVASQVEIHQKYGGIVPEVAARKHVEAIIPVIQEALGSDGKKPDLIAVTYGPGLITALQVGVQVAKTLSYVWKVPLVGVNHLEAHLWSHLLPISNSQFLISKKFSINNFQLPAIGLIISGGHTEMVLVNGIGKYKLIGRTRDDSAGEAFDKVAKLMGLDYPGGPIISHFAKEGDPKKINFPRPMLESNDFDFSFSGIKTAVKYYINGLVPKNHLSQNMINDICASFQAAVIEVLSVKAVKAAQKYKVKSIILGGGVSANEELVRVLGARCQGLGIDFYYPEKIFTQDNAAMIALAGYFNIKKASRNNWRSLQAEPNLSIEYLSD